MPILWILITMFNKMIDKKKEFKSSFNENELKLRMENNVIDVDTGEIRVSSEPVIIRAVALGSCIAVIIYDRSKKIGGISHIMLPGRSPKGDGESKTKYAESALDKLFNTVKKLSVKTSDLEISIVGGANILQEGNIPDKVAKSVLDYLKKLNIEWNSKRVGGTERRSVFLDITSGKVLFTEGDSALREL